MNRLKDMEKDLAEHKLSDATRFAELTTKSDEVARRLDQIDNKLDRLLERK